jgi:hypothetical protein
MVAMTNHNYNSHDRRVAAPRCAAIRDLLPRYVTLEVLGHNPSTADARVAEHCAGCAECQAELDELRALMAVDPLSQGDAAPPSTFNLFFLHPPAAPAPETNPLWQIDPRGRLTFTFSQTLFTARQPSFAGARRGQHLYTFDLKLDPPHGCNVVIKVIQSPSSGDASARLVDVEVNVEVINASPLDQSGSDIVIVTDSVYRRDQTDMSGCARFSGVPLQDLSELRVEVLPRQAPASPP